MNPADIDWVVLRRPLTVLIVSVAISVAVVAAVEYYSAGVERSYQQESQRLNRARSSYLTLDDEKRLIQEFYPQYAELAGQGRIGDEQRLSWIEALRDVATQLKLPSLQYEIGTQQQHEPDFPVPSGRFKIFASEMDLDIGLLHEVDLLRFLDALRRRAAGLFSVSGCRLERVSEAFEPDPTKANLEAACRLRWYTIKAAEETARPRGARGRRG